MRKIFLILCMLISCSLFLACKKNQLKNLTNIGYGTSFGKCIGYCKNSLSITDSKIEFSKSTNDGKLPKKDCSKSFSLEEFNALKLLLSSAKIDSLNQVIGCPDCADGGAEWISANVDGKDYKITFEYGKAPKNLEALTTKLRLLKDGFQDCK